MVKVYRIDSVEYEFEGDKKFVVSYAVVYEPKRAPYLVKCDDSLVSGSYDYLLYNKKGKLIRGEFCR